MRVMVGKDGNGRALYECGVCKRLCYGTNCKDHVRKGSGLSTRGRNAKYKRIN